MDLPRRYPYNPQWRFVGIVVLISVVILTAGVAGRVWTLSALGTVLCVFSLLMVIRRVFVRRFIELEENALQIPSGLLRMRIERVSYADIESEWETTHPGMLNLTLLAKGRTFEIRSNCFSDVDSYKTVRGFMRSLVESNSQARPKRPRQPGESVPYAFQCNHDGNGEIYNPDGEVLWHTKMVRSKFFSVPDFAIYDADGRERFRIKLERRLPLARFIMTESGGAVCTIRQRSFLFTKYALDFVKGPKWTFHMPLFTVHFKANSKTGAKARVRLRSHPWWYVLIDDGADTPQLVAALAFIHRERLRHG